MKEEEDKAATAEVTMVVGNVSCARGESQAPKASPDLGTDCRGQSPPFPSGSFQLNKVTVNTLAIVGLPQLG